jgi:lipopolysaccharide export system protein LptA
MNTFSTGEICMRIFFVMGAIVLSAHGANAQSEPVMRDTIQKPKTVHIDIAENMVGRTIDLVEYQFLSGIVELSQGGTFLYCDSAVVIDEKEVFAYGNVIIQKGDSLTIFADTLIYHSDSMYAELLGEVILNSDSDQLWTTHLEYDLENDLAYYYESAVMLNDSTQVSSKIGYYWTGTSRARFIDSVVVIGNQVTLLADSLDYNTETQVAEFLGPTLIVQDKARIYCEDGYYDVPNLNAEFIKNARYENEEQFASADTIEYIGQEHLVHLRGNAHFEEGDKVIDSDTILFYEETGETLILGNAIFRDSTTYAESDRMEYNRNTELLKTEGRSLLVEGAQKLTADLIDFDKSTGLGIAQGDVVYFDTAARTILVCDTMLLNKSNEFVEAFGSRRPLLKSIMEKDTMFLTADTLQFLRVIDTTSSTSVDTIWAESRDTFQLDTLISFLIDSFKRFQGFPDVRFIKGTMQGVCDSLEFNDVDSVFHMIGNPVLWSDTTQFTADTIHIQLKDSDIDRMYLIRKAIVINVVESIFYNQIKGKRMLARLEENEVKDLFVSGNAESVYYARDEEGEYVGVNRVAASEIFFTFEEKQLAGIHLYGKPDGKMTPMEEVNHNTLRLDGFDWRDAMRPVTLVDLF